MRQMPQWLLASLSVLASVALLACGEASPGPGAAQPRAAPTIAPTVARPTATTLPPTVSPRPTATVDVQATTAQRAAQATALVQAVQATTAAAQQVAAQAQQAAATATIQAQRIAAQATAQAHTAQATAVAQKAAQATAAAQHAVTATAQAMPPTPAKPVLVSIVERDLNDASSWQFQPATITVPVGVPVRWTNKGQQPHTVTHADKQTFDSGLLLPGKTYEITFTTPGEVPYFCRIHPWMVGKLIVTAG